MRGSGIGVLKVKLWFNIEFCNSVYLPKLDFQPRIYMWDGYVSNNCPALCSSSGLWSYFWGWGEDSESNFLVLFFIFYYFCYSIQKHGLVENESRAITLCIKDLCCQPPRKTPSQCLQGWVTKGTSHASCFMAMLSVVVLCKRAQREAKKGKDYQQPEI